MALPTSTQDYPKIRTDLEQYLNSHLGSSKFPCQGNGEHPHEPGDVWRLAKELSRYSKYKRGHEANATFLESEPNSSSVRSLVCVPGATQCPCYCMAGPDGD